MKKQLTKKVSFDFIRYANCWEDADVLLEGLNPAPNSNILSVGSAGDNSFSLLCCQPKVVVAIDVSKTQLYLIELKKCCIQHLSYQEVLAFFGFTTSKNREVIFNAISTHLSVETREYWMSNMHQIKSGVITQGKLERYFQWFSRRILPWIHSRKTIEQLFSRKDAQAQSTFYDAHWNTWRWRLLFKIFFSKYVMGRYGRDPQFLKEVRLPVSEFVFQKAERHLKSTTAQQNFILRYHLTGNFGSLLPHYLQPENFDLVKANIEKLKIREGYAEKAMKEFGTFKYLNLSNIFEYMDHKAFNKTAKKLLECTESGGKIAYWNFMVPRRISANFPQKATYLKDQSEQLSDKDKGFFYDKFIIDQIQ